MHFSCSGVVNAATVGICTILRVVAVYCMIWVVITAIESCRSSSSCLQYASIAVIVFFSMVVVYCYTLRKKLHAIDGVHTT